MADTTLAASAATGAGTPAASDSLHLLPWAALLDRLIILIALICIGVVIFRVGKLILAVQDGVDVEVRKIRFASVTFTGIMVLLVFVSLLYFLDKPGSTAGQTIFEKTITALTPLAGAIIGYLFGGRGASSLPGREDGSPPDAMQGKDVSSPRSSSA